MGGVFYSIELLPDFWQSVSKANPIIYTIDGFRYGFLGFSDINILYGIAMLVIFGVGLFSVNLYLLKKGVGIRS